MLKAAICHINKCQLRAQFSLSSQQLSALNSQLGARCSLLFLRIEKSSEEHGFNEATNITDTTYKASAFFFEIRDSDSIRFDKLTQHRPIRIFEKSTDLIKQPDFYNTKLDGEDNGPQRDGALNLILGNPVAHLSG